MKIYVRGLLFLLLAGNLLLVLWYLIIPTQVDVRPAYVGQNSLLHKREIDQVIARVPMTSLNSMAEIRLIANVGSAEVSQEINGNCFMFGPFDSEEQVFDWFGDVDIDFEVLVRRVQDTDSPYYRVFAPAAQNRAGAMALLVDIHEAIRRSGAQIDSYIVPSGPLENAISLGLFGEQVNALNVQRILGGQGINAVVESELRLLNNYWLVAKNNYYADFKRKMDSIPFVMLQDFSTTENLCETIAQAE